MTDKIYIINGKEVAQSNATVSAEDYGLMRGYAVFETIRFDNRTARNLDGHIERLLKALKFIRIHSKIITTEKIKSEVKKIININSLQSGLIKIIITRGNMNTSNQSNLSPNIYLKIKNMYSIPSGPVRVVFYDESRYPILRFNPAIKSINYLGNMMAIEDAQKDGAFEVVFYNNQKITECSMRNIFFIKDNNLITPALELGILSGTIRSKIANLASKVDLKYLEEDVLLDNINQMDEAFICSSVIGILPCYWNNWKSDYKITKDIQFLLEESL